MGADAFPSLDRDISGLCFAMRPRGRRVSLDVVQSQESRALLTETLYDLVLHPLLLHPNPFTHQMWRVTHALPTPSGHFKHQMVFKSSLQMSVIIIIIS